MSSLLFSVKNTSNQNEKKTINTDFCFGDNARS